MKTYILRDPKAVEPQNRPPHPRPHPLRPDPAFPAASDRVLLITSSRFAGRVDSRISALITAGKRSCL